MENGGNAKVNAIFEAKLAQSGRTKPTNLADGPTRERYIRDKFERRKFYDPAGFSMQSPSGPTPSDNHSSGGGSFASPSRPGALSDAARRRVASRQARMKPVKASPVVAAAPATIVAQAPVSAPVEVDLLDFGSDATATTGQTSSAGNVGDLFAQQPVAPSVPVNQPGNSSSGMQKSTIPPPPKSAPPATASTTLAQELLNNPAPATKSSKSNDDIMALFGSSKQQQNQQSFGFGMQGMNSMNTNPTMANGMTSQQRSQSNMMSFNNQQNMMSQQQQQQQRMMMAQNNMMPNQMMQQQMMQQQMMMQKQRMMQQQQMANRMQMNNSGSMMNNMGMFNSPASGGNTFYGGSSNNTNNMNQAMQGMQNMNIGNTTTGQTNDDGGFGSPMGMGGGPQQQSMKSDAFSSLGGMNAFR